MRKPNTTKLGRSLAAASAGLMLAAGIINANAAVRTWDGGGDPDFNWSNPLNWDGDSSAPVNSDHLVFDGTVGLTNTNDIGGSWLSITFAPTAGQFLLDGTIAMSMGTGSNAGFTNSSTYEQTINIETKNNRTTYFDTTGANIVFTKRLWDWRYRKFGPNDLVIRQTLVGMNGQVEQLSGGRIILNGLERGPLGQGLQINSGGTAVCAGPADQIHDSDSRADVTMSGGLFQVQNTNSLGVADFEQIPMLRSADLTSVVENGSAVGPVQIRVGGGTGARVGAFDGTLQDGNGGGALSVMLDNFSGACYWRLGGTNTYTGETVVTNNTASGYTRLIVNGQNLGGGDYTVGGGVAGSWGVLSGAGTIVGGNVNINANGAISPGGTLSGANLYTRQGGGGSGSSGVNTGTFDESTATLTIDGAVTLADATSALQITLGGTNAGEFDQLVIGGSGTFSNNNADLQLSLDLAYAATGGDKFTIVEVPGTAAANNTGVFTSLNGVATDLSQGATFTLGGAEFKISYRAEGNTFDAGAGNGNNIMLEVQADTSAVVTWRGDVDGEWDIASKLNWRDTNNVASTFTNGSRVIFDDTGIETNINLTTDLTPKKVLVDSTKDYTFATTGVGKLTGLVSITKTNSGKLVVTTDNDFSGSTKIEAGTVQIGDDGFTGALPGAIEIQDEGILEHKRADDQFIPEVSGTGTLVHSGTGKLLVTNTVSAFTGTLSNQVGTVQLGDGTSNLGSLSGTIDVAGGTMLQYSYYNGDVIIANHLSGSGTVRYDLFDNVKTYTIPKTFVNSNFHGAHIVGPYVRLYAQDSNAGYIFGDGGTVTVENFGQAYMDRSATTYSQNFILQSRSWGNAETGDKIGGIRAYQCTISGTVTFGVDALFGGNCDGLTISGQIIGNGHSLEIKQSTATTLVLSLSNSNNAWGTTIISSGGLRSLATGSISTGSMLITNGYLDTYGTTVTVSNLSGTGVVYNKSSSAVGTMAIGVGGDSGTFDGTFVDGGSRSLNVTKQGSGTLTLTAASPCTGTVAVEGGTLALSGAAGFASAKVIAPAAGAVYDVTGAGGTLTLNNGQTLKGSGSVNGNVSTSAGSTINPGDGIGALTINGNATLAGLVLMELNRTNSPATNDSLVVTGTLTPGGSLTVSNTGPALVAGDRFPLFSAAQSGFTWVPYTYDVANLVQYTWQNDLAADGSVSVASVAPITAPTLSVTPAGNTLTFNWTGPFKLQTQTNALSAGLGTNWSDYPNGTNGVVVTINPANPTVFFRLTLQ